MNKIMPLVLAAAVTAMPVAATLPKAKVSEAKDARATNAK